MQAGFLNEEKLERKRQLRRAQDEEQEQRVERALLTVRVSDLRCRGLYHQIGQSEVK